jgi:hypothetical protein
MPDQTPDITRLRAFSAKPEKIARRKQRHCWRSSDCSAADARKNVHAGGLAAGVSTRSAALIRFLANRVNARTAGSLAWLPAPAFLHGEQ